MPACFLTALPTSGCGHCCPQAVRDELESTELQTQWLRSALPGYFTKKLLHQVDGWWGGR